MSELMESILAVLKEAPAPLTAREIGVQVRRRGYTGPSGTPVISATLVSLKWNRLVTNRKVPSGRPFYVGSTHVWPRSTMWSIVPDVAIQERLL